MFDCLYSSWRFDISLANERFALFEQLWSYSIGPCLILAMAFSNAAA